MYRQWYPGICCFLLTSGLLQPVNADEPDLRWFTIDGGGDMWCLGGDEAGQLELSGTIGQPDAGVFVMTGGTLELVGGFWAVGMPGPPIPGDCDGDGDVDFTDFVAFADCMNGPEGGLGYGCACADFDLDSDVDLADFARIQIAFTNR